MDRSNVTFKGLAKLGRRSWTLSGKWPDMPVINEGRKYWLGTREGIPPFGHLSLEKMTEFCTDYGLQSVYMLIKSYVYF